MRPIRALTAILVLAIALLPAARSAGPLALEPAASLPEPRDRPYAGLIRLDVDASSTAQKIFTVHETIPVAGGEQLVLLYPEWFPGNHSPTGRSRLSRVAGLTITQGEQVLPWSRDPVNMYAFHVTVPPKNAVLEVGFQYLAPPSGDYGRSEMSTEILTLDWNAVLLYPAGYYARQIPVEAHLRVPAGWQLASALERTEEAGGQVSFRTTSLETLVDSPVYAGAHVLRLDLMPGAQRPVYLNLFADRAEQLQVTPDELAKHRALIEQAYRLFGSQHYDHYDFLVTVSEGFGPMGVEHHRSSFDGVFGNYFTEWSKSGPVRDLLAHEFAHSWNGKFRRPADLWTPTYNVPMRNSLLWVYEGQTQYWGEVLAARAGLRSLSEALDALALTAARYQAEPGRQWRPLGDTTDQPIIAYREPLSWRSWQRASDYYDVGLLIWLDADTLIRERSHGARSLDDFARQFFGVDDGSYGELTYSRADVVAALNRVQPYDWESFLRQRIDVVNADPPLAGIARGGYRLTFTDTASELYKLEEERAKQTAFTYSLGLTLDKEGRIRDVLWDGPAFKAGLSPAMQIIAVNGTAFDAERLKESIQAARSSKEPLSLIVREGDQFRTLALDYHGGLRYPHLERDPKQQPLLEAILAKRP
jgi:predicted metalloprotease with PDZ domain